MRINIERRLHRVKIELDKSHIKCIHSKDCDEAANCDRCNEYYEKCSIYIKRNKHSL